MPKIVYTDIDGCLIGEGVPTAELMAVFEKHQKTGLLFSVVTGRGRLRALEALGEIKTNAPLVLEDGGRIISEEKEVAFPLSPDEIRSLEKINSRLIEMAGFAMLKNDRYCFYAPAPRLEKVKNFFASVYDRGTSDFKLFLRWAEIEGSVKITLETSATIKIPRELDFSFNEGRYNLNPKGVSKGRGIQTAINQLGAKLEDVILIGNDHNDISMFGIEGPTKVAVTDSVGSCPPELERLATAVSSPLELPWLIEELLTK